MSNVPQEAMLTPDEFIAAWRSRDPGSEGQAVVAIAAAEKGYRAACLEVDCWSVPGPGERLGECCSACHGTGKRWLTAADVARAWRDSLDRFPMGMAIMEELFAALDAKEGK